MGQPLVLTMDQLDAVNLSLAKATSISQMIAECGSDGKRGHPLSGDGSLFVVMQVVVDELEAISKVLKTLDEFPGGEKQLE